MKILMKGKVKAVSIDRIKPAHFECASDTGTEIERETQQRTTHSKTAGIARRTRKELKGSSSKFTVKPVRQGIESHTSAKKQFSTRSTGSSPAITPQSQATRAHLPRQQKPYIALHSQTPTVTRANGSDGVSRTYSRVPLHLRDSSTAINDTNRRKDVRRNSNIADSDKDTSDNSVKQTRVGREIHTPARLVQMVHAVVAPNDIYSGTNCTYRYNRNL